MRLLRLELKGKYKGLENQVFDFTQTNGNIIAFIGLNGSGKSQLLELIAETFAYIERWARDDFLTKKYLPFIVEVTYMLNNGERYFVQVGISNGHYKSYIGGKLSSFDEKRNERRASLLGEKPCLPDYIVGYASGLNENLQRAFMKNSLQVFNVLNIKHQRGKELVKAETPEDIADINKKYVNKYSFIYKRPRDSSGYNGDHQDDESWEDSEISPQLQLELLQNLKETATPVSKMIYLDYDSATLVIFALAILPDAVIADLFQEIPYCIPKKIIIHYDLKNITSEDAIADIHLFGRVCGVNIDIDESPTGNICFDLADADIKTALSDAHYGDPFSLFERLYKFLTLSVRNWSSRSRQLLQNDAFLGTVKKPLKTKLPLEIISLELANKEDSKRVEFDDLSDGEAQLMQILGVARIFCRANTLFLLDEPETHLNPSWRTYFHKHLGAALKNAPDQKNENTQVFLSTHSPFMISSLKKDDVFSFERNEHGRIVMEPVSGQTYGTSFDVLIKQHFHLRSLISQTVVSDVKAHLPEDTNNPEQREKARQWIEENMGESMEKAYLLSKLKS